MSRIILKMSVSVDGFVASSTGELDWVFKSSTDTSRAWLVERLSLAGAHLMGSKTFVAMAGFCPTAPGPFAASMNSIPKIVFSKKGFDPAKISKAEVGARESLPESAKTWTTPTILTGDLSQEITRLKQQSGKDLIAHGGSDFAQSLVRTGLVDEYWMVVHPVALGRGAPLFAQLDHRLDLKLKSSQFFDGGIVANIYQGATEAKAQVESPV